MKSVDNLAKGDYVAFGFNYNGGKPNEIIVEEVLEIRNDEFLVHFLYGIKENVRDYFEKEKILAIGNNETGEGTIKGWGGKYNILNKEEIDRIEAGR